MATTTSEPFTLKWPVDTCEHTWDPPMPAEITGPYQEDHTCTTCGVAMLITVVPKR